MANVWNALKKFLIYKSFRCFLLCYCSHTHQFVQLSNNFVGEPSHENHQKRSNEPEQSSKRKQHASLFTQRSNIANQDRWSEQRTQATGDFDWFGLRNTALTCYSVNDLIQPRHCSTELRVGNKLDWTLQLSLMLKKWYKWT